MLVLIDNYDSFSYNLYQLIGSICPDLKVVRNDALSVAELLALKPTAIVLSPGPGRPEDADICLPLLKTLLERTTCPALLGVCLGHQALAAACGATVIYAPYLMHGKASNITLQEPSALFTGLNEPIAVARYHSLAVDPSTVPACLQVTATTTDGVIMALEHSTLPLYGVQFHPESILTPQGLVMLRNFLEIATEVQALRGHKPAALGGYQPAALGGHQPAALGGHQPAALGGYQPEALGGYQPEALGGHKPEALGGHKPAALGGHQPEAL